MQSRTLSRELALLVLGQIPEGDVIDLKHASLESLLQKALDGLTQHWREGLDSCAEELEKAQQKLIDFDLQQQNSNTHQIVGEHLHCCLQGAEEVLNSLSASLELPRLLVLGDQEQIRLDAMQRISFVLQKRNNIDSSLDDVMEGWRLSRLPRIDRDILRLAVVDLNTLKTPAAVACNEAVELANRYSDDRGRRMINGVLRRLQDAYPALRS